MSNGGFAYTMYPLVNFHSSLLKLATEIVDLAMKNGDFP
jgi:hypothetical protein